MLARFLQIRRGESSRAILLFAYLFLVVTTYVVTKATRDALFLERYLPARLPLADIASALTVGLVMAVYLRLRRHVSVPVMLVGTLVLFSVTALGFWALVRFGDRPWMLLVLYVWAGVYGVLLPAQVWTLANFVLTTREAKRLYGFIGSGAISGWIVGGLLTRTTATWLGTESLLLMTSAALAVCPLLVGAIWRTRPAERSRAADESPSQRDGPAGLRDGLRFVWRTPSLRSIASIILLSSLVTTVVAWQFRAIAKAVIPETNALTAFFGTFNIYAGLLSLTVQLFLTSRLLRRFGLGVALLIVPLALTVGSVGVLVWGGLAAAVLLKGGDQVLRYSIDRSTVELLYLPVPERQTVHAKTLIDTVLWRVGDCLGALVVLACVMVAGLSATQVSLVTIALLVGWMVAASSAQGQYVQNLRLSMYEHRVDAERLSSVIDRSTSSVLTDALHSNRAEDILFALALFTGREAQLPAAAVRSLLDHASPLVRREAIATLSAAGDADAVPKAESLLHDDDPGVRAEALLFLTRVTHVDPLTRLHDLSRVDDSSVASAMAAFLGGAGPSQNLDAVRLLLDAAIAHQGPDAENARAHAARLLGSLPSAFDEQLHALLQDRSPEVARWALRSAAALGTSSAVPLLLARLGDPDVSLDAAQALTALGERAVPALGEMLNDETVAYKLRSAVPGVLQDIGTASAEQGLVDSLLNPDPVLRLCVISALNKMRQLHPGRHLESDLVKTVLAAEILGHYRSYQLLGTRPPGSAAPEPSPDPEKSMVGELERIFRLMKVLFPSGDWHSVYFGLRSENPAIHANTVEFLEHTLPPSLRALLLPLVNREVSVADRVKIANQIVGPDADNAGQALLRELARTAELRFEVDFEERGVQESDADAAGAVARRFVWP